MTTTTTSFFITIMFMGSHYTRRIDHPVAFTFHCLMAIPIAHGDTDVFMGSYPECIARINSMCPHIEFRTEWEYNTVAFIPTGRRIEIVEDPECSLFGIEVPV
jgi:hypothetical protein